MVIEIHDASDMNINIYPYLVTKFWFVTTPLWQEIGLSMSYETQHTTAKFWINGSILFKRGIFYSTKESNH